MPKAIALMCVALLTVGCHESGAPTPPPPVPPPPPPPNYTGTWTTQPRFTYTCASGAVAIDFAQVAMTHSADTLRVTPQGTQPGTLTGTVNDSGRFAVQRVIAGGATETYRLAGMFVTPDSFLGQFSAEYTGAVGDCLNQSDSLRGRR